jgi:hypothetical protein
MELSEARRLKVLEKENAKLNRLLADAMLDVSTLREMLGKKLLTPSLLTALRLSAGQWFQEVCRELIY